jgi:hypothetical protein
MNMPITSSTTKEIWILTTGILAGGVLVSAATDLLMSFRPGFGHGAWFYGVVAALSILARFRLAFSDSARLVSAAGISSAGIAAFALADVFSPGASRELIDASGVYLLLGTWLLGIDAVYREIEIARLRQATESTAGE